MGRRQDLVKAFNALIHYPASAWACAGRSEFLEILGKGGFALSEDTLSAQWGLKNKAMC